MDYKKTESWIVGIVLIFAIVGVVANVSYGDFAGQAYILEQRTISPRILLSEEEGSAGENIEVSISGLPILKGSEEISIMFDEEIVKTFYYSGEGSFKGNFNVPFVHRGTYQVSLKEFPEANCEFFITRGIALWSETYGTILSDTAFDFIESNGDYVISGQKEGTIGGGNAWLIRVDEDGEVVWEKNYGGSDSEQAESIIAVEGGYLFAGETWSYGAGSSDFYFVKVDEDGEVVWEKNYGGSGRDEIHDIIEVNGGYLATGYSSSYSGNFDVVLLKIDENGREEWIKYFGGSKTQIAYNLVEAQSGYLIVARDFDGYTGWIIKVDEDGEVVWEKNYEKEDFSYTYDIIESENGYIVVGTTSDSQTTNGDLWIFEIDEDGEVVWEKVYDASITLEGYGYDIIESENGYMISYSSWEGNGKTDFIMFEIDEGGNREFKRSFGGSGYDNSFGLVDAGKNQYLLVGSTESYGIGETDIWLVKVQGKNFEEVP